MATLGLGLGQDAFTISSRVSGVGGCFPGAAGVRAMTAVANSPGVLQVLDVVSEGFFTVHFSLIGQRIQADEVKALEHLNPSGARRPTQPG